MPATIKDIASMCGVSESTVSKALNGRADVSPKTSSYIRLTAESLGYYPSSIARSLRTSRTYNLGVLFADALGSGLSHEYFSSILDSFMKTAQAEGYSVTFLSLISPGSASPAASSSLAGLQLAARTPQGSAITPNSFLSESLQRGFDGVAVVCADYEDPDVLELINGSLPVITIDRVFENRTSVVSDNFGGMQHLMERVVSLGHTRIAYIHGELTAVTKNRLLGLYKVCHEHNIWLDVNLVREARYRDADLCRKVTAEILDEAEAGLIERPTCILYPDDYALIGGLQEIVSRCFAVPGDISIVGYDGSFIANLLTPRITTIKQDTATIGTLTATKLIAAINDPKNYKVEHLVVPFSMQEGESLSKIVA